jgi:hypothetical protein
MLPVREAAADPETRTPKPPKKDDGNKAGNKQ